MDALLNAALAGTGRQPSPPPARDVPTEDLATHLPAIDPERQLLLRAGAWAAYRLAGQSTSALPPPLDPAPPETLRCCSLRAAQVIVDLTTNHGDLLPEALGLLRRAGQIMPPDALLPLLACDPAHNSHIPPVRANLVAALGERGRWLARQNDNWRWVLETVGDDTAAPSDADTIWQEGTPARRRALFAQVRHADPARARDWLAAVWKQEKADTRAWLVAILDDHLDAADEPFLNQALEDRSDAVRTMAAALLVRLPTSACSVRMRERADEMLFDCSRGVFQLRLPSTLDAAWIHDGIEEVPPQGVSKHAWWLIQVLGAVPPKHWQARFSLSPTKLIAAAQGAVMRPSQINGWSRTALGPALIEGWSRAALTHSSPEWLEPLWYWWFETDMRPVGRLAGRETSDLRQCLAALVPQDIVGARVLQIMSDSDAPAHQNWGGLVAALPVPWNASFGQQFLAALRAAVASLAHPPTDSAQWLSAIARACAALPASCFAAALADWEIPELEDDGKGKHTQDHYTLHMWKDHLERLCEALRIRQTLYAEITAEEHPA